MRRDPDNIKVMGGSGYKLSLAIIAVMAAALLIFLLIILPAINEEPEVEKNVVSITYEQGKIGMGTDLQETLRNTYVKVAYSDGTVSEVALSNMICKGLDITKEGVCTVALTYGDFHQTIKMEVVSVDCKLMYQASIGGRVIGQLEQSVFPGNDGDEVRAVPDVGYVFIDWNDGNPEPIRKDCNVRESAVYTARFEKAKYTVVFKYPDGTVTKEQLVAYNEAPTQVPSPLDKEMQVYGYEFDRWNLPFDHVTQDMTIEPIFVKKATDVSLEITRNNKGEPLGTVNLHEKGYYPKNKEATLLADPMPGRAFSGWQIKRFDGVWEKITVDDIQQGNSFRVIDIGFEGNGITFEAGQTGDTNQYFLIFTPSEHTELIELKADFVYEVSTITFINSMSANPGNIERTVNLPNGQEIGEHLADPVGSGLGYRFVGWYRDDGSSVDEFGNEIPVQPGDTFTQPVTLVARWQKVYCQVNFLRGDGDLPPKTVYVLYQNTLASAVEEPVYIDPVPTEGVPSQIPKREHYIFVGWYLVGDGGVLTDVVIDDDYKVYEDINVRPKFIPIEHDLEISFTGAGRAQRKYLDEESAFEPIQAGVNKVLEIGRYIYRFIADDGYQIKSITVNGITTNYQGNTEWADTEVFYPTKDMTIWVEFVPKTYLITINNGNGEDGGIVKFMVKTGDDMEEIEKSDHIIEFYMEHNSSRNIHVTAQSTHFINKVSINGISVPNIPWQSSYYTITLTPEIITGNTLIDIEYLPFAYTAEISDNPYVDAGEAEYDESSGSYYYVPKKATYAYGADPAFKFEAAEGYYIAGLRINGKKVDLYSPDMGFEISQIIINNDYSQSGGGEDIKDDRVTSLVLKILAINGNYVIESLHAPLYYHVKVSRAGRGYIDNEHITVSYGDDVQIQAQTDGGYYVKGYTLNGQSHIFEDMLETQTIDIENITADIDLQVEFSIATFFITFDGSKEGGLNSQVRRSGEEYRRLNAGYTAEYNSVNGFTLLADVGYYISKIIINGLEQVIPYGVTEYSLQIDNVDKNYHVEVNCRKQIMTVRTQVNNDNYGQATAQTQVEYGGSAVIEITYSEGYTLDSVSEGTLSADNTVLTISNVTQNKLIIINFKPIIYNIICNSLGGGDVTAPLTAERGSSVFIRAGAFGGNVIDAITLNEETVALAKNYSSYVLIVENIEDNVEVTVSFKPLAGENPQSVNILQSGGLVNGSSGNYTATVWDNISAMVLITAPQYHYVASITGQSLPQGAREYALEINKADGVYDIYVEYEGEEYAVDLVHGGNGEAEILVNGGGGFEPSASARYGDTIRIVFTPDTGYCVDYIKINGQIRTDYQGGDHYDYTGFAQDQSIEVAYRLIQFAVNTEVTGGYGIISAQSNVFEYGKGFEIRIIPAAGYYIATIVLNGQAVVGEEAEQIKNTFILEIEEGSALSKADIDLKISFERVYHMVNIALEGEGSIAQDLSNEAAYGEDFYIDITADENNFIEAIEIDGVLLDVDNTNLRDYTLNAVTREYTAGRYVLKVTKDIQVRIYFRRNIYSVTIMPSVNGVTTANMISPSMDYSELNINSIEHGNFLQICMSADTGYNISALYINGKEITGFKHDNVNANNNRLINYIYEGENGEGVSGNILIRVDYDINYYKLQYELINESPNFREFDTLPGSFGSFEILGHTGSGNIYSGIPHGENFRLRITPLRERGYIISGITITYKDPASPSQTEITIRPQVGGAGSTVVRTGDTLFFSELMGQHASAMVGDVQNVQIRFTKETFTYDQEVITAQHTGTISTRFYHPNDSSRFLMVGSEEPSTLHLVDGKYEYGLGYTISVVPAKGYSRTAFYFLIGGTLVDRNANVRANTYNSIIQSNISAKVEYEVNRYDIRFNYLVYDSMDRLISNPGDEYATIWLEVAGGEIIQPVDGEVNYYGCPYGARLRLTLSPNYADRGYYIHSLIIGTHIITEFEDKNSDFTYVTDMGDGDLTATAVFRINTYTISFIHIGDDDNNSVSSETQGKIPWGTETVTLKVSTDTGYNLLSLEVYQNGEWTERKQDIQYNIPDINLNYRDILQLYYIKENITVRATYERKQYQITAIVNDLDLGALRVDAFSPYAPAREDIPQQYSQKTEEVPGIIVDPYTGEEYPGMVEKTWDIVTMTVSHYDELVFYLWPVNGYKVIAGSADKVRISLYKYVNGERVPYIDNFGNPVVYNVNAEAYDQANPDYRRFTLPLGVKVYADLEIEVDFLIKTYLTSITKTPFDLSGVEQSQLIVQRTTGGTMEDIEDGAIMEHFDTFSITLDAVYGLSLDALVINGRTIPIIDYVCENNQYTYYFYLQITDELLNGRSSLDIEARMRRNIYNVSVTIFDEKSQIETSGKEAPTLRVETVEIITHGNTLNIKTITSEGYSVRAVIINGEDYTAEIAAGGGNINSQFGLWMSGDILSKMDVHNADKNTLQIRFITDIDMHISSIRAFVYEQGVDTFSDIAGNTTAEYAPADTMKIIDGKIKYEYFTEVTVTAVAISTPEKTYRFAYFQEELPTGWQTVRHGERGIELSGENNNVLKYTIREDKANNVSADRYFRAVYYRVLTVSVTVMPQYKYVSGQHTARSMKYLPYLTAEAYVGGVKLEDKNPENALIYAKAAQQGTIPYVEKYTYYVDSGSYLVLKPQDHVDSNLSSMGFYDKEGSADYRLIPNATSSGIRIVEDRDIYLVARNSTMLSFDISTIKNESGIDGGRLAWKVFSHEGGEYDGSLYRGSLTNARALDTVQVTVRAINDTYRFTGLYVKNVDRQATEESGELKFVGDGEIGEWTLIDSSSDLIHIRQEGSNTIFTIFVTENMVMKFEFYRTFKVTYSTNYQGIGEGPGELYKDEEASSPPVRTQYIGGKIDYEIYDYNSQIRLITPTTDENYQFVGWFVNGDNIYTELETQFPDSSICSYWFKFYQNSQALGIYDGLDLYKDGADIYEVEIVATYQPIYKISVINELYFYHGGDDHWNTWSPSMNTSATYYPYYTSEQVFNGESEGMNFALPSMSFTKSIFMDLEPRSIMEVYNSVIPERALNAIYDNQAPPWSQIRAMIDAHSWADWSSRYVYSETMYFRMLLQQIEEPHLNYNAWTENTLYLDTYLYDDVALVEWQYYNWNTGQFEEIPYMSQPILGSNGQIIGYSNNAKRENYYIRLSESADFIDHTKPFVIRPMYQKKVKLTLGKKAYYNYLGDDSTIGNSAQTPQIHNSPDQDMTAEFNYYSRCLIIPRAGTGYRFIGWFLNDFTWDLDNALTLTNVPGEESTAAWEVHLKFEYGQSEQYNRYIHGRYIKQWTIDIISTNVATGDYAKNDAPKLVLRDIVSQYDGVTVDTSMYRIFEQSAWRISVLIDAGLDIDVDMDSTPTYNSVTGQGFSPVFDKYYDCTNIDAGRGERLNLSADNSEALSLYVRSYRDKQVRVRYESFGEITFTGLMWYSAVRLTDIMASYILARFGTSFNDMFPEVGWQGGAIYIGDTIDGVIDGRASFNRIPIRDANYLGTGNALTYDFVPYGFDTDGDRCIKVKRNKFPAGVYDSAHFSSALPTFKKQVTIDFSNYKLFGIASNTSPPGTEANPYLIGVNVNDASQLSSVAQAREQFRNIEVFFDANGSSCKGVVFKLRQDIHLNSGVTVSNPKRTQVENGYTWVPICWSNDRGFDGVLEGNGKTFRSLIVDGSSQYFVPYSMNATPESVGITVYQYNLYGYGIFSCLQDAVIRNVKLGTTAINLDVMRNELGEQDLGIGSNVGILAARIIGNQTVIENISFVNTTHSEDPNGYVIDSDTGMAYNYAIMAESAQNVGIIAGSINCDTIINPNNKQELNSLMSNMNMTFNVRISASSNAGVIAGWISKMIVTDISVTGGTIVVTALNQAGGFAGMISDSHVDDCHVSSVFKIGSESSNNAGGFVGMIGSSMGEVGCVIEECSVTSSSNSFIMVTRAGNETTGLEYNNLGTCGGFAGNNANGEIINCSISNYFKLYGYYVGGIAGVNSGKIKDCRISATGGFMIDVEAPLYTNGAYGIIAGANMRTVIDGLTYVGLISDCGVIGSGVNTSHDTSSTVLQVKPAFIGLTGKSFKYRPGINETSAVIENAYNGYTSIGGIVGLNNRARVFNSYTKRVKILTAKVGATSFNFNVGGVVGFNYVSKYATGIRGEGVSSCYADGNAIVLSIILWADTSHGMAYVGLGGVAGGTQKATSVPDDQYSIRYSYGINNVFRCYNACYGEATVFVDKGWPFKDHYNPKNNYTKVSMGMGMVVGGGQNENSASYYCWGGTTSSFVPMIQHYKGSGENYEDGAGNMLRDGPDDQSLLMAFDDFPPDGVYDTDRWENKDQDFFGRTMILSLNMHNVSYYSTKSGNNMPACYGGFIGREHNGNRNDSRVIRTNEEGHLLYNISGYDFDDSGNYIGSIPWSTIINSLVKDQTKYSGNF